MRIDITDPAPEQRMPGNKSENLVIIGKLSFGQIAQCFDNGIALTQAAQCQFADHVGMAQHLSTIQQFGEPGIGTAQMVDPHRAIDKDQA